MKINFMIINKINGIQLLVIGLGVFEFLQFEARADDGLTIDVIDDSEFLGLKVTGDSQKSQRIEFNGGHGPWAIMASETGKEEWSFPITTSEGRRIYRVTESVRPRIFNHSSWKPTIEFPDEPFLSKNLGESFEVVKWVKFAILTDDANRVYFQDSNKYLWEVIKAALMELGEN